jgi:type 1 fimbria pilin
MKKLFLFVSAVALSVSLNSCSSDSDGGSSMSMKVNGVKKTFKTTAVNFGGTTNVYGYIGNADNPTEEVSFALASGTGDKVTGFNYDNADGSFFDSTLTSDVTVNSATNAKGTFTGNIANISGTSTLTVTEGTFSAKVLAE